MKQVDEARLARKQARLLKAVAWGPRANVSFRRNFLPAVIGVVVTLGVLGAMNGQWLYAQYRYRTMPLGQTTQPATVAPVAAAKVASSDAPADLTKDPNPEKGSRLEIPAIGVQAPVMIGQGTAEWQIQTALRKGVVHYDGAALPGQSGNVTIFGHSSGQLWAPGEYKFVFTLLDKLQKGDQIHVYYQGTRYTYTVASSQVVAPSDVGVLNPGPTNELTLITCTPVGTSTNRLVVSADQTSPKPATATTAPAISSNLDLLPGSAQR